MNGTPYKNVVYVGNLFWVDIYLRFYAFPVKSIPFELYSHRNESEW